MLEEYKAAYLELSQASSAEFADMLSKTNYKKAVRQLMGNNTAVVELGLSEQTVRKLERSNIRNMDILVDYYDKGWLESRSYLKEIANKLETYIRDLLSMLVVERETVQTGMAVVIAEADTDNETEKTILWSECNEEVPSSHRLFIQHDHLQEAIKYYKDHDEPIEAAKLSNRSYNTVRRAGYQTVSQLLSCTNEQIAAIRNLGTKSKQEIHECMVRMIDLLCPLPEEETIQEKKRISKANVKETEEMPVKVFRNGNELFANSCYRDSIIRFFEKKQIALNNAGLSVRSVNALARNNITDFCQLLALYPEHLSDVYYLRTKSISELRRYVEDTLKQYTASLTHWLMDGKTGHFKDQEIRKMIMSMYHKSNGFYGYSFREFREEVPGSVSDAELRASISALLKERKIEYVDFRCYKVYSSFYDFLTSCGELNDNLKEVLTERLQGKNLREIADRYSVTRERIRQKESKALALIQEIHRDRLFDEDYYRYLYENYFIPKEAWFGVIGCTAKTFSYLTFMCKHQGKAPLEDAMDDPHVTVNLKYRLQKYIDKRKLLVNGVLIERNRFVFERAILEQYCRDEMTFDAFTTIYNSVLQENNVPEEDAFYLTEENKHSRVNHISRERYVLWKHGGLLRYYDTDSYDYTELLDTLNLSQYRDIEISANKFMLEYPELMKRYDIRDCNELHCILKSIVNPKECSDIVFSRQPIIRFGHCDRRTAALAMIEEHSPISTTDLISELQSNYGYNEEFIRANVLPDVSELFHNGFYSADFATISESRRAAFCAAITEDYYTFDELRAIYQELYPDADTRDVNPRMLKQMGFLVNGNYIIQHYHSADELFSALLTKDDVVDLAAIRKRYSACMNTIYLTLRRKLLDYDLLYFEPDRLLSIRRLAKLGVTKEILKDYCESAIGLAEKNHYFTIHSLRRNGFNHTLDNLGLDDYFYNALLSLDEGITCSNGFGTIILYKGNSEKKPTKSDFIAFLIHDDTVISLSQIEKKAKTEYGVEAGKDKYDLAALTIEAAAKLGMYYDKTMEKVYKDKSYYFEDLERMEKEELF